MNGKILFHDNSWKMEGSFPDCAEYGLDQRMKDYENLNCTSKEIIQSVNDSLSSIGGVLEFLIIRELDAISCMNGSFGLRDVFYVVGKIVHDIQDRICDYYEAKEIPCLQRRNNIISNIRINLEFGRKHGYDSFLLTSNFVFDSETTFHFYMGNFFQQFLRGNYLFEKKYFMEMPRKLKSKVRMDIFDSEDINAKDAIDKLIIDYKVPYRYEVYREKVLAGKMGRDDTYKEAPELIEI